MGINRSDAASGNGFATAGRTLPWLQDSGGRTWTSWAVTYRDVVILDAQNRKVGVYNLTTNDLNDQENYDALKALLLEAAGETPSEPLPE